MRPGDQVYWRYKRLGISYYAPAQIVVVTPTTVTIKIVKRGNRSELHNVRPEELTPRTR